MSVDSEVAPPDQEIDVEDLGRQLGEAITDLPEYETFEAAQEAVKRDDEAQEKIQEFEQLRQQFMLARQTGTATEEDLQEIQSAQQGLHSIPVMAEFLKAQASLTDRLEGINEAISEPLAVDFGEEAGGCCQD